ncbi:MAG: alpha-IPM isomerase [Pseudomonadota bacterium]|nr:alpha-IPM isomerase [Pseudomonadota bacterium]
MSRLLPLSGRARCFGDDVGTDAILSPARRRATPDPVQLRRYLFESDRPTFAASVREGDILVAGRRFGDGPITELTVTAILCAGIRAIVAQSFSRIYLRNALNNGLLAVSAATDGIAEGDPIALTEARGREGIELRTPARVIACDPLPPFARSLLEAGGLVPYLRLHGSFGPALPGERL